MVHIAITNQGGLAPDKFYHRSKYIKALRVAGAIVSVLPLEINEQKLKEVINKYDGFVFTGGGADVNPELYGEERLKECGPSNDRRDKVEMALLKELLRTNIPILGICRGMQVINVACGGTLYQDIPSQSKTKINHSQMKNMKTTVHKVKILDDTKLESIVKSNEIMVNTVHHQAVKQLGKGLRISALAPDNIVEAMEGVENNIIAVQWHPEHIWMKVEEHKKLFVAFIKACKVMSLSEAEWADVNT